MGSRPGVDGNRGDGASMLNATRGQLDEEAARTATRGGEEVSGLWDHRGWGKGAVVDSPAET